MNAPGIPKGLKQSFKFDQLTVSDKSEPVGIINVFRGTKFSIKPLGSVDSHKLKEIFRTRAGAREGIA